MTLISLVCLLVVSSSAFGGPAYGGYSSPSFPQVPSIITPMREKFVEPQPFLPTLPVSTGYGSVLQRELPPPPLIQTGYGQPRSFELTSNYGSVLQKEIPPVQTGYGSSFERPLTRVFPTQGYGQGYGSSPRVLQLDQTLPPPPPPIVSPADMLCQGQPAEFVIPIEDNRRFVVCIGDNKGVVQSCPKGLFYHTTSRRCERKLGPLENVCASSPCLNGGQCVPTESWYQCQCAPGFDGHLCEFDARYCQSQFPCGQSPDVRCQSFRAGAALQWICIFQDGLSFGLSTTQVVPTPCQGVDGPQALGVSNKGFVMCDGERSHVESCPGGTIWDNLNKACTWPDMEGAVDITNKDLTLDYGRKPYGETRTITTESRYGGGYGTPRIIEPTYGGKIDMLRHFEKSKFIQPSGYGTQERTLIQPSGYGAPEPRIMIKTGESSGYGAPLEPRLLPKLETTGYGAPLEPRVMPKVDYSGYGTQPEVRIVPKVLEPMGYGGESRVFPKQIKFTGYGQQEFKPTPEIVQVKQLSPY